VRLHLKITLWIVLIFFGVGGISIYALLLLQRAGGGPEDRLRPAAHAAGRSGSHPRGDYQMGVP